MYNTESDKLPEMTFSFETQAVDGLKDQLLELEDSMTHKWFARIKVSQVPHPGKTRAFVMKAKLHLETSLDLRTLLRSNVLNSEKDSRLIGFIGGKRIEMYSKPRQVEAESLTQLRVAIAKVLKDFESQLQSGQLEQIKRRHVLRWIDQRQIFGAAESY